MAKAAYVPPHAVVGYIHGGTVRAEFCASMIELVMTARTPIDTVLTVGSGPNISTARNKVVDDFLRNYPQVPWLWMLDTDMVFAADALDRLVAAADRYRRPLLGALCYSQNDGATDPYPTMYEMLTNDAGVLAFSRLQTWPEDTCVRVTATGAACLLMHRDALVTIGEKAGDIAAPWFRESPIGAPLALMGEDLTFCLRAGLANVPVHVHTGVQIGHMKPVMLGKVT